jgi:hypothetical protein
MPRTIGYWLTAAAAAAALLWAAWPGAAGNPATLISRVDVVAAVVMLAGLPLGVRRRFGPVGRGWMPRLLRTGGYVMVTALILVKADVEQRELARLSGTRLAGVWFGEVVFLVVIAAYVAALLSVTARRPPASPATLAIGTGVGVALGLAVYALRPLVSYTPVAGGGLLSLGKIVAVLLVLYAAIRAAIAAARRSSRRGSQRQVTEVRAQQGLAAGICIGIAAALLVSVLGISTIALAPHTAGSIQWILPDRLLTPGRGEPMTPDSVSLFEVSVSRAAAGYLLVLIIFPLLGAGLGAWGGLFAEGDSGHRPGGGGGGGGPEDPDPGPMPPGGGRELLAESDLSPLDVDGEFGLWDDLAEFPELDPASPERIPAGVP